MMVFEIVMSRRLSKVVVSVSRVQSMCHSVTFEEHGFRLCIVFVGWVKFCESISHLKTAVNGSTCVFLGFFAEFLLGLEMLAHRWVKVDFCHVHRVFLPLGIDQALSGFAHFHFVAKLLDLGIQSATRLDIVASRIPSEHHLRSLDLILKLKLNVMQTFWDFVLSIHLLLDLAASLENLLNEILLLLFCRLDTGH